MNIGITIVRDNPYVDFEHYRLLRDAFEKLGHNVDLAILKATPRTTEELETLLEFNNRDRKFALHLLGHVYISLKFDIPLRAAKTWYYRQGDCCAPYSGPSIQNCKWKPEVEQVAFGQTDVVTIQMPYGVPAPSLKAIRATTTVPRDIDVLWMGSENVSTGMAGNRHDWLSAFEEHWVHMQSPFSFRRISHHDPSVKFAEMLQRTKILLCPRGCADYSFRLHEGMESGCCCVAQPMQRVINWKEPEGVVWAEEPELAASRCEQLLRSGMWSTQAAIGFGWHAEAYGSTSLQAWAIETAEAMIATIP